MTDKPNPAASVAARLLNRAKQTGDDYQLLLTSYCLERFLYRLAISDRRERFVLKGAMLLRLWSDRPYRATLDLDLFPAPELLAYPREAVVAEKLEAMVVLGDRNSRIKDFFDLHHLATSNEFDRANLTEAVRRTFERRRTPIPAQPPIALTHADWDNPSRPAQVRAFARRARIAVPEDFADECARTLDAFLSPVLEGLRSGRAQTGTWRPGEPWR